MKFVFFSVSENGDNGLRDEVADGGNALSPRILGLESPLDFAVLSQNLTQLNTERGKIWVCTQCTCKMT